MAFTSLQIPRSHLISFSRFLLVGGTGFVINAVLLLALTHQGLPFYVAQIIGAETAVITNFLLHDAWTFSEHVKNRTKRQRLLLYNGSSVVGMLVNTMVTIILHSKLNLLSVYALAGGSVCALFINYLFSILVTWRSYHDIKN